VLDFNLWVQRAKRFQSSGKIPFRMARVLSISYDASLLRTRQWMPRRSMPARGKSV
jgi:hypothetical protein